MSWNCSRLKPCCELVYICLCFLNIDSNQWSSNKNNVSKQQWIGYLFLKLWDGGQRSNTVVVLFFCNVLVWPMIWETPVGSGTWCTNPHRQLWHCLAVYILRQIKIEIDQNPRENDCQKLIFVRNRGNPTYAFVCVPKLEVRKLVCENVAVRRTFQLWHG